MVNGEKRTRSIVFLSVYISQCEFGLWNRDFAEEHLSQLLHRNCLSRIHSRKKPYFKRELDVNDKFE